MMFVYYPIPSQPGYSVKFSLENLYKLKELVDAMNIGNPNLKRVNISEIARQLNVDRRTAASHYNYGPPSKKRNRKHYGEKFRDIIYYLLVPQTEEDKEESKKYYYVRHLYNYLRNNCGYKGSENAFRRYIYSVPEFAAYFGKSSKGAAKAVLRIETPPGEQAQIDWKESIPMEVTDQKIPNGKIHVFVFKLSHSRRVVLHLVLQMTQDILFSCLVETFEILGGVPKCIVVDNMKTAMTVARSRGSEGIINEKFQEFAKDFGFEVKPCMAHSPQTKGKVESFMKILDQLRPYSGKVTLKDLEDILMRIAARYNMEINIATGRAPLEMFEHEEKSLLLHLPGKKIRDSYKILQGRVKVNRSGQINYLTNTYSVPPQYIGKYLTLSTHEEFLYLYDSTSLVATHRINHGRYTHNTLSEHRLALCSMIYPDTKQAGDPLQSARENLKRIGDRYKPTKRKGQLQ